ncbi:hypothetical protein RE6C_00470 [Rhodopirellula europaea 6C]|uniref:Uncharacterized protein n=1 Tax=Rhodopirellula europaea 6C TaxID=1263867 RepID=M2B1P0_9BACT|nr:hypothetical protein RE6C_00470 [Rhodopirellula europaea 6C]
MFLVGGPCLASHWVCRCQQWLQNPKGVKAETRFTPQNTLYRR